MLTNPPPSSGGILIAFALELLERLGGGDVEAVVAVMRAAKRGARRELHRRPARARLLERFLDPADSTPSPRGCAAAPRRRPDQPGDALGSTTHLTAIDADGCCASVTCSNGTGSGLLVPGTGVHVNNMLGEEDLNPLGFHRHAPGRADAAR